MPRSIKETSRQRRERRKRAVAHRHERMKNGGLPQSLEGHRMAGAYLRFVERLKEGSG